MFNRDKHIIVFYKHVSNLNKTNSLIAIKKKYHRGDCLKDINSRIVYNVLLRDSNDNNLLVLKEANVKLNKEEKQIINNLHIATDIYISVKENKKIEKENRAAFDNIKMNFNEQYYDGFALKLIDRKDYYNKKAKRYTINDTNQNVWIPNTFLKKDGTIKPGVNLGFIFNSEEFSYKLAKIINE